MNNNLFFDWGSLLIGIQFMLGFQLIVISFFLILRKKIDQRTFLGVFCLIEGLTLFKYVFFGYWQESIFMYLLVGQGKPVFIGSVLLFYYKCHTRKITKQYLLKHLWAPSGLFFFLMFLLYFPIISFSSQSKAIVSIGIMILGEIIHWTYFFFARKELRRNVKQKLIPKAYKKNSILFYSFYFISLQITIWDLYARFIRDNRFPENIREQAEYLYFTIFKFGGEFMSYVFLHIFAYFLFIYALSELLSFKKVFLPKDIIINQNTLLKKPEIDQLMHRYFQMEKIFKNPEITLDNYAVTINVTKKELIDYFKLVNISSFKTYVNEFRIQEFKNLIKNKNFQNYDLVSLSEECGFNSKTTFFRVFREMEGMTPNEYKKLMEQKKH